MPFVSEAQRRKFHALVKEGKLDPTVLQEWEAASKGLKLPERVRKKTKP